MQICLLKMKQMVIYLSMQRVVWISKGLLYGFILSNSIIMQVLCVFLFFGFELKYHSDPSPPPTPIHKKEKENNLWNDWVLWFFIFFFEKLSFASFSYSPHIQSKELHEPWESISSSSAWPNVSRNHMVLSCSTYLKSLKTFVVKYIVLTL